ncbi:reprolysin-like metallopeptidase [Tenacibaculum sp. M341]|uniref:reprolysin-like metallopeptidase n=1 Tax=Tenacibaculum sp. M341 TaxID=2530339 RepID=UPI0010429D52|nr:zinc-dependent metalloprotease family protein [Tenacibaculum sp. M341]TCI94362.1 T9SS type A sorting domain-containing protein [Tenacibaculum sp. M341]
MKKITLFLILLSVSFISGAQSSWKKLNSKNLSFKSDELTIRKNIPKTFDLYNLNLTQFKNSLKSQSKSFNKTIELPSYHGSISKFYIKEVSNFTESLNSNYGFIKSYNIQSIGDNSVSGKLTIGNDGVHVTLYSKEHSTLYIDPYTKNLQTYISYTRKNVTGQRPDFKCSVHEDSLKNEITDSKALKNADDGKLRSYRLALSCTGEYAQFHINNQGVAGGTEAQQRAAVLSAMNTTMARVNGIFERDIAARMNIVLQAGENPLIFLDPDTDDLSNASGGSLLSENQTLCDNVIGNANYDIGHVFSTGGGGVAYLGSICNNSSKAGGVTGLNNPIGDFYDVDYVAHEIGHQFGAPHTFNSESGACGDGNRWDATAVEPGAGTTIMGYAGICNPHNVENNSDDYFHTISIQNMWNRIQATSCAAETDTGNTAPTADAGSDYSVPKSTPLKLRGTANDADGNGTLTYNWEQMDNEIAAVPPSERSQVGALFRSVPPTSSPDRYLPALATVIGGAVRSRWEVIPDTAREINFAFTVRDNHPNGGSTARDDMVIFVTDAEPFTVTAPTNTTSWDAGTTQSITWDKSTTDVAPINCQNVNIKLSTDGGNTFPITLVANTPNDGVESFTVPNNITNTAKIMIEAADNIFYNVNDGIFSIVDSGPSFVASNLTPSQEVCGSTNTSVNFDINVDFTLGFAENVNFSVSNLPTNATSSFSVNNINSAQQVTVTIGNLNNVAPGEYDIIIEGVSASITKNLALPNLKLFNTINTPVTLDVPTNNSINITTSDLRFNWIPGDFNTTAYDIEIATDSNFSNIVFSGSDLTNNEYTVGTLLDWGTTYFWRVRSKNLCGNGSYSSIFQFKTEEQSYCQSTFFNIVDSEFISNVTFNTINNSSGDDHDPEPDDGYQDFTSVATTIVKGETYPINVTLNSAGFQDHCYVYIDWNRNSRFDNDTERYDLGTFSGEENTGTFDVTVPEDAELGRTRMRIVIEYFDGANEFSQTACNKHNSESGETEDYSLFIVNNDLNLTNNGFRSFALYPNPSDTTINLTFNLEDINEDVLIDLVNLNGQVLRSYTYKSDFTVFQNTVDINGVSPGMYLLRIQNAGEMVAKKIIIE